MAGTRVPTALETRPAQGSLLACGVPGRARDTGGVVVADETGFWTSYSAGLGERETGSVGATGGVAVAYTDLGGIGEIIGCGAADCSVAAADLSGDGRDEIIRVSGAVNIEWSDAPSQDLPGIGMLTITDIDADGSPDILLFDEATGRTLAYRTAGASSAWPVGWHTERPLIGPVFGADLSGDGISELAFRDAEGRILHTEATIPAGM